MKKTINLILLAVFCFMAGYHTTKLLDTIINKQNPEPQKTERDICFMPIDTAALINIKPYYKYCRMKITQDSNSRVKVIWYSFDGKTWIADTLINHK